MKEPTSAQDLFRGRHFDQEIIVMRVRWYLTFKLVLCRSNNYTYSHAAFFRRFFGFGHSDLLRLHRRRRWIGGLELAELLFFLLRLLFNLSLPLFELIVWFCQFVILLQG